MQRKAQNRKGAQRERKREANCKKKTANKEEAESESDDEDAQSKRKQYHTAPNGDTITNEKFQSSPIIVVTSKDTEAAGDLNLAVKRAKPNNAGPSAHNKKGDTSKKTVKESRKTKTAKAVNAEMNDDEATPNSSTPEINEEDNVEMNLSLVKRSRKKF